MSAMATDENTLFFPGCIKGMKARTIYLWYLVNSFFSFSKKSGSLEGASFSSCHLLYRCDNARQNPTLIPHICFYWRVCLILPEKTLKCIN